MAQHYGIEGDILATFAIDSGRQGVFAVFVIVKARGRRYEIVHFKCDALESYIVEIRGGDQAAASGSGRG